LTNTTYNVYIYTAGDQQRPNNDQGDAFIEGLPSYAVNGVTYFTATIAGAGAFGQFTAGQLTNVNLSTQLQTDNPPLTRGNFIVVSNVFGGNGQIQVIANADPASWRSPINGVELVPTATVPTAPVLVTQTASLTNYAGQTITLVAGVTGTPLHFQWLAGSVGSGVYTNLINSGNISGATNFTLTISNALPGNMADYILVVTNALGAVTSSVPTTVNLISLSVNGIIPADATVYPGATAAFSVSAVGAPLAYQWQKISGGVTNNLLGATNNVLSLPNVGVGDVGAYQVVVTTPYASAVAGPATLSLAAAPSDAYGQLVASYSPVAYWRFDEGGGSVAYDYAGGHNGIYGASSFFFDNGPSGPGFPANSYAFSPLNGDPTSFVSVPAASGVGLNTNTATIVAWVNPFALPANAGIVVQRDASGVAGLGLNASGHLTYNWNNDPNSWGWDTGLVLPTGQWSMVALVTTATNTTIYLFNAGGQSSAVLNLSNTSTPFTGALEIGADAQDNSARVFSGDIDEVAIYRRALTSAQVIQLYTVGAGIPVGPSISLQPVSQWTFAGHQVTFTIIAAGTDPLVYQWQVDTGSGFQDIPRATNATLVLSNVNPGNVGNYLVNVANPVSTVASLPASLNLLSTPANFETNLTILSPLGY
ncbi:MAG TPA: LamG-like jellyroll fold domain-containing protein, partial [Verrucomicrobiae bacterium]